jgi:hypothetical protein
MSTVFWAVIGIGLTTIFGIWSIVRFSRQKKYPGQIFFVVENNIALFDSILKNSPELKILYEDQPINEGLVLLKGALVNTGIKDISKNMTTNYPSFSLPKNYK